MDRRTHIERINPTDGMSHAAAPGAGAVSYPQPVQTHNGTDIPIGVQFLDDQPALPDEGPIEWTAAADCDDPVIDETPPLPPQPKRKARS